MKEVTGRNKKQFEEWLIDYLNKDENGIQIPNEIVPNIENLIAGFYEFKFEMQIGVLLAYYDSLDIKILIDWAKDGVNWLYVIEIKEFGEKLSEAEKELQEQLDYQKSLEQDKPEKLVINIDETAKIDTDDSTEKKKG